MDFTSARLVDLYRGSFRVRDELAERVDDVAVEVLDRSRLVGFALGNSVLSRRSHGVFAPVRTDVELDLPFPPVLLRQHPEVCRDEYFLQLARSGWGQSFAPL